MCFKYEHWHTSTTSRSHYTPHTLHTLCTLLTSNTAQTVQVAYTLQTTVKLVTNDLDVKRLTNVSCDVSNVSQMSHVSNTSQKTRVSNKRKHLKCQTRGMRRTPHKSNTFLFWKISSGRRRFCGVDNKWWKTRKNGTTYIGRYIIWYSFQYNLLFTWLWCCKISASFRSKRAVIRVWAPEAKCFIYWE